jgi:hypothetical protein
MNAVLVPPSKDYEGIAQVVSLLWIGAVRGNHTNVIAIFGHDLAPTFFWGGTRH